MSDWTERIANAFFSDRLDSQASIDAYKFTQVSHFSLDTSIKPSGSTGSMKIDVLSADDTDNGSAKIPFGQSFSNGSSFWVSFRVYAPPRFCYQPWPTSAGISAHKFGIVSNTASSFQTWECVWQATYNRDSIMGYWQNGVFNNIEESASTACSASDFRLQPKPDNGANPLSGNDPDTGSAWTSCQQDRKRYGSLYTSHNVPAADFAYGYGDPIDGCFRQYPDEWLTLTMRVEVGNFNSANNRLTMWCARNGQAYKMIADKRNITIGQAGDGPFNCLWLLPYVTNRIAGGRKITSTLSSITGVTLHTCGLGTPVGDGTLEYNATTQRFRWKGIGETYGTARGFSAANGKLILNVKDSVNSISGSYVVIEVVPASLPSSGTTEEAVTISTGRPDTHINYADVILSQYPINAPGGFAPTVLGQLARDTAVGTWAQLTPASQDAVLGVGSSNNSMLPYANTMPWNPINQTIEIVANDHPPSLPNRHARYDDITNTFELIDSDTGLAGQHGYDHNSVNPITGDIYHRNYGTSSSITFYRELVNGVTFSAIGSVSVTAQITSGTCWWSGSFTGGGAQGSLMLFDAGNASNSSSDGTIAAYNPLTSTWFYNETGRSPNYSVSSGYGTVMKYSAGKNVAVYGAGSGASNKLWKMDSTGTVTAMTNVPTGKAIGQIGNNGEGNFVDEPVTGNFVMLSAGELWELNPDGSGTWTQQTGSRDPPAGVGVPGTGNNVVLTAIEDYGVLGAITQNSATGGTFYIYKHAEEASGEGAGGVVPTVVPRSRYLLP